jgi:hypothetical protein
MTLDALTALVLGAASGLAVAALFPHLLTIAPRLREQRRQPLWLLITVQTLRTFVLLSILAWCGLRLASPFALGAPLIRSSLAGQAPPIPFASMLLAIASGVGAALLIVLLDRHILLRTLLPVAVQRVPGAVLWKGLLGSFYGAIVEEILSRLFLMTVLVWILSKLPGLNTAAVFSVACLLSALAFAAGHLPLAAQTAPLTKPVVTRVLVLNTLAGLVFGAVFWSYGLEHAMAAHFAADVVLQVAVA